ncbi:uncharacterized protein A4U43_C08F5760 [Asparagus officinalis]|nr:uncharacterized protein A4U43_C08F5760 [Asparagus officinalis]
MSRSTSTGYGRRLFENGYEYGASTPYYQMGEPKRRRWSGILKRMLLPRRSKKKIFEPSVNNLANDEGRHLRCVQMIGMVTMFSILEKISLLDIKYLARLEKAHLVVF